MLDDRADLVGIHHLIVQPLGRIGHIFVQLLPAFLAGELFPDIDVFALPDDGALLRDLCFDQIDVVADVDPVGHGLFVGVFADDILVEKAEGPLIRRGRESDEKGVEVFEDLLPEVVDAAVAFVDDDEIEEFDGEFRVVNHGQGLALAPIDLAGVDFFGPFVQLFAFQDGIEALDRADADLAVGGDVARFQALDVVEFGEFAVVVVGQVGHELLFGLFAQVPGVHQEENPLGIGELQEPVDGGDGGEGLARTGRHLDEGAGFVGLEGEFQVVRGVDLAIAQALRREIRQIKQPVSQGLWLF